MMGPNLYQIVKSDSNLVNLLGVDDSGEPRFYPFGRSEEDSKFDKYAFYNLDSTEFQTVLEGSSKSDLYSCGIVVIAKSSSDANSIAEALINCLEPYGNFQNFFTDYDYETRKYVISLSFDIFVDR